MVLQMQSEKSWRTLLRKEHHRQSQSFDSSECPDFLCEQWTWSYCVSEETCYIASSAEGYSKWTLRLLANKCVELNYAESLFHVKVSRVLKETNLSLTWKNAGVFCLASRLDIAEIELSALARQCIGANRIPDLETLRGLLKPWYVARNQKQRGVQWHFTTDDAKVKLARLYSIINI